MQACLTAQPNTQACLTEQPNTQAYVAAQPNTQACRAAQSIVQAIDIAGTYCSTFNLQTNVWWPVAQCTMNIDPHPHMTAHAIRRARYEL